jgi:phosphoribosylamine--glycine ligase
MMFPLALDYKRTLDGDLGKNCDGMGSISPHPSDCHELRERLRAALLEPLLRGLRAEGLPYTGFLYLGMMLTERGPVVFEINARFGDSEAEAVLPGVRSDFLTLCRAVLAGTLDQHELVTDGLSRCSVALVQGCLDPADPSALVGWPFGEFTAGQQVRGLDAVDRSEATLFYANLRHDELGVPSTSGGRVLHVVGVGANGMQARSNAYRQLERISFTGMRVRHDIGQG